MKLRVARHTSDLNSLINFFTTILGLKVIGNFKDHAGYDGVFIGGANAAWHLEFTTSAGAPEHVPDEDDLLVFYVDEDRYNQILQNATMQRIEQVAPKNPYWEQHGITLIDPDGFRIVVTINNH